MAPPPTGQTFDQTVSKVMYGPIMKNAEIAAGSSYPNDGKLAPPYPPSTASEADFQRLMTAIGMGIGSAAAHELGHQLGLPYTDCGNDLSKGAQQRFPCEKHDNFVYNFFNGGGYPQTPNDADSVGAQFKYIDVPGARMIHWGPSADCTLKTYPDICNLH
jgi:hypothetical protein